MTASTRSFVWAVRHRDGACAARDGEPAEGEWNVATECGYYVVAPWGFDRGLRHVTCDDCRAVIRARKKQDGAAG